MTLCPTLNPEIESWLPARLEELINGIAKAYQVKASVSYRKVCDVAVNDQKAIRLARHTGAKVLGEKHVKEVVAPAMLGYDIASFLQEVPGAIIHFGNGDTGSLLSPSYDFNDELLPIAVSYLVQLALSFLSGKR